MKRLLTVIALVLLSTTCLVSVSAFTHTPDKKEVSSSNAVAHLPVSEVKKRITTRSLLVSINQVRIEHGLQPFKLNSKLEKSAELKCADMVKYKYYAHNNPVTKSEFGLFIKQVNQLHNGASENLNVGDYTSADEVITSWMNSKQHRESILDASYTEIGFATCIDPIYPNWLTVVQHKIKPLAQPASQTTTTKASTAKNMTCNSSDKSTQDHYYNEILKTIEQRYDLESHSPDSVERSYAELNRDSRKSDAKYHYNINLIQIGCSQYVI